MVSLTTCDDCGGFVPEGLDACPNCLARPRARGRARRLWSVAGGGAVALTLMACYGAAPQYMVEPVEPTAGGRCGPEGKDLDQDGYCAPDDCDEVNANIHPDAEDPAGDGVDQNCDGADGLAGQTMAAEPD